MKSRKNNPKIQQETVCDIIHILSMHSKYRASRMSINTWKGGRKRVDKKNIASISKQSASHTHSACHSVDKPRPLCHFFGKPRPVDCHSRATCPLLPASMSTRQIGHFLLVVSHWSTHGMWNKCMHGSRLRREDKRKLKPYNQTFFLHYLGHFGENKTYIILSHLLWLAEANLYIFWWALWLAKWKQ